MTQNIFRPGYALLRRVIDLAFPYSKRFRHNERLSPANMGTGV